MKSSVVLALDPPAPLYQQVKRYILSRVASGEWPVTDRVPSENELVRELGISRMTINRALKELTAEGVLTRLPGVGTFVAAPVAHTHPLQIRNIAEEIAERGHGYQGRVLVQEMVEASADVARDFEIATGSQLFHTVIVHLEAGYPIQLEDRLVSPVLAPGYLDQDFSTTTPHEFLIRVAPLQQAEHAVRAVMPDDLTRERLEMEPNEPCLLIRRLTWTDGRVASYAKLFHPGYKYELSGRFGA